MKEVLQHSSARSEKENNGYINCHRGPTEAKKQAIKRVELVGGCYGGIFRDWLQAFLFREYRSGLP